MNKKPLTPNQARKIKEHLQPMLRYLSQLVVRMEAQGMDRDDELLKQAEEARNSLLPLLMGLDNVR